MFGPVKQFVNPLLNPFITKIFVVCFVVILAAVFGIALLLVVVGILIRVGYR